MIPASSDCMRYVSGGWKKITDGIFAYLGARGRDRWWLQRSDLFIVCPIVHQKQSAICLSIVPVLVEASNEILNVSTCSKNFDNVRTGRVV